MVSTPQQGLSDPGEGPPSAHRRSQPLHTCTAPGVDRSLLFHRLALMRCRQQTCVLSELHGLLSVWFCAWHCGRHGGYTCEDNTQIPLLRELPCRWCTGKGRGQGAEKDCEYKSARVLLLTRSALEKYRAGKGTRGAGGGATAL